MEGKVFGENVANCNTEYADNGEIGHSKVCCIVQKFKNLNKFYT